MVELLLGLLLIPGLCLSAPNLRRIGVRGLLATALLAALATGGRAIFAAVPSVQPSSFLVLVCGMTLGGGAGFLCGIVTAVLSSFLTSIGPWTMWQALLWGLMGASGAVLTRWPRLVRAGAGLLWGFLFGWVMNLWYYTLGLAPFTVGTYLAACAASFFMDLAHGVCNAALLLVLPAGVMETMHRLILGERLEKAENEDPQEGKP